MRSSPHRGKKQPIDPFVVTIPDALAFISYDTYLIQLNNLRLRHNIAEIDKGPVPSISITQMFPLFDQKAFQRTCRYYALATQELAKRRACVHSLSAHGSKNPALWELLKREHRALSSIFFNGKTRRLWDRSSRFLERYYALVRAPARLALAS